MISFSSMPVFKSEPHPWGGKPAEWKNRTMQTAVDVHTGEILLLQFQHMHPHIILTLLLQHSRPSTISLISDR